MNQDDRTYTSNLVAFAAALRERGVDVSTDDVLGAARAMATVDPLDRDQFYYGLKTTVIDEPGEAAVFDELFAEHWDELSDDLFQDESPGGNGVAEMDDRVAEGGSSDEETDERVPTDPPDGADADGGAVDTTDEPIEFGERRADDRGGARADDDADVALELGRQERSTRPSVEFEDDPLATDELRLLVGELGRQLGALRGFRRRTQPSGTVDLRRSLDVVREGNPKDLPRVERERTRAKVRLVVDVSHSMLRNMHQELLLLFLFECMRQFADVRIFLFDTEATEVTRYFRSADLEGTLREMRRAQTEWGAGTTIGDCLQQILTTDPFVVDRETVAIVVSDGWDAGDDELLREQMQELGRRCRSLMWFNPRATSPNYEPAVTGMRTALEFVDFHFGFGELSDLGVIVEQLRSRATAGR